MSASSSTDCYLCGAVNDADASYCKRCAGQLLRIPADDAAEHSLPDECSSADDSPLSGQPEDVEREAYDDEKPKAQGRKGSLQDQRLSDALGLQDDVADQDLIPGKTSVTTIPRASPSADIPLLGTRAGSVPQSSLKSSELGARAYVLLGLLVICTAWLGYTTLTKTPTTPSTMAFTETTTPPASSTTTTEKPERLWQPNEVEGRYSFALVRLDLVRCPTGEEEQPQIVETTGVNVTTHNVVYDGQPMPFADYAIIKSRIGTTRLAILEQHGDGVFVATSLTPTSRNLQLDAEDRTTDPAFYVAYDPTTNVVSTTTERQQLPVQIEVGANGQALAVHFGRDEVKSDRLRAIDARAEVDPEHEANKNKKNDCGTAASLRIVGSSDDADTSEPEQESTS